MRGRDEQRNASTYWPVTRALGAHQARLRRRNDALMIRGVLFSRMCDWFTIAGHEIYQFESYSNRSGGSVDSGRSVRQRRAVNRK